VADRCQSATTASHGAWRPGPLLACGAVVVVLLAAVLLWWERCIEAGINPVNAPYAAFDDYLTYYPTSFYGYGELRAGRFPFWNPYQEAGAPFFATPDHGLLYPLNLAYLVLPTASAEKVSALLHLTLAGLGASLLARAWGRSWVGALTSAAAFAFAPPVADLVFLPHHLDGVAWMPWQLLVLHRLLGSPIPWTWGVLLGVSTALQYLGGYPMYGLLSAYVLAGYFCWWHWGAWRTAIGRRRFATNGVVVAAAALLAVSLSAPQLLPRVELMQRSLRGFSALSLEQAGLNSVPPVLSLLRAVLPMHDVERVLPSVYLGVPLLFLAALGTLRSSHVTAGGFSLGLTVLSWLLAWGTHTPLFRLYHLLPGGSAFRVPYRFFPVTSLGIAMLAGAGADALREGWPGRVGTRVLAAGSLGLGVAFLLIGWYLPLPDQIDPASTLPPSVPLFMASAEQPAVLVRSLGWWLLGAAAWLFCYDRAGMRLRGALIATLPAIAYSTLFVATKNTAPLPVTHPDLHTMPERAAAFLRAEQGFDRTYVAPTSWPVGPPGRHLPAKAGELHGLYAVNDRENVYSKRFAEFAALLLPPGMERERAALMERLRLPPNIPQGEVVVRADSPNLRLLDLLGTRFIVEGTGATFHSDDAPDRFELVYDAEGVRIYRNLKAFPRAFLVHRAEVLRSSGRELERLASPDFDPRTTALLERPPSPSLSGQSGDPPGTATIVHYAPDQVVVDVDASTAAILVLTDQHYPGWEAEVDGTPTEILVTDYVFRGVPVNAGIHRVVFRFVPHSFRRGLWVAAFGSMLTIGTMFAVRRRSLNRASEFR
jgi:hypothetical protein